jgi:hypothetical protein
MKNTWYRTDCNRWRPSLPKSPTFAPWSARACSRRPFLGKGCIRFEAPSHQATFMFCWRLPRESSAMAVGRRPAGLAEARQHRRRPHCLRYCSSLTCSIQSTTLPSCFSWMAIWVSAVVGVAPCQCFSPGENQTTSPGRISSTGPPSC